MDPRLLRRTAPQDMPIAAPNRRTPSAAATFLLVFPGEPEPGARL